jgi:tape measure domain-containing protein
MVAGSLTYDTKIDTNGFKKGIGEISNDVSSAGTKMRDIIGALGITKIIGTAISTINQNIDAAVERVDALNNFPKVMSNLGISAEASQTSINKLSEKLRGLPTTLNDGALAVQRFASANGSVEKSTEIFLALNNAILAGGASTEIQKSALEQLSQAYAKGRPDMMEWRTALMAMPAQIRQVADTFDMTSDQLGEALREGNISMDDFTDRIIEMNTQGVNGFKSFEEQAKNSVDGIKTATTNMKTAIARGIGNVITSINKLLKKNNLGGVSDVINKIGSSAEKVISKVGKLMEKINIKKLLDALKKLIPVITAVVAGFTAYNAVLKVLQAINIVKNIASTMSAFISLIPAITGAKDAMLILNMTFNANAIGLVVAAIAGLVAGLTLLNSVIGESDSITARHNNTIRQYKESMEEADKARQEYLDSNMNEVQNYQDLAAELNNIVDENGKVKEGYEERAKFITSQLSEALGIEIKLNDGIIEGYQNIKKSIADVLEAKRAQILLDAQEKEYNTALDQRNKLEEQYTTDLQTQTERQKELDKWTKSVADKYGTTEEKIKELIDSHALYSDELGISRTEMMNLNTEFGMYNSKLTDANKNLAESRQTYLDNEQIIADYGIALGYMKDQNYSAVLGMYEDTTNYIGKTNDETYNNYQAAILRQQDYLNSLKANQDKYSEEEYQALLSSGEAKLTELQTQQAKYKDATKEGQEKVTKEWNSALAEQLTDLTGHTVEFKTTADGHVQAYIDGVKEGKPMSKKEANKFGKEMASEIDKAKDDATSAGTNLINGTTLGIQNQSAQSGAFSAISSFGNSLLSRLKSSLKEHSPSQATREMGQFLLEGLNLGVDDEKKNVLKNIDSFGDEVLSRMENAVNMETGKMSFSGTAGSVSEILNANATFEGTQNTNLFLDGEKVYENQQKISARKNLQYGGAR